MIYVFQTDRVHFIS